MRRARGFTLLEVMVALAVLAIAMAALIRGGSTYTANAVYLRDKSMAHWVAMNTVAEYRLDQEWPAVGERRGSAEMAGREWYWEAVVTETADADVRRLEVAVRADERGEAALDRVIAFLPRRSGGGS